MKTLDAKNLLCPMPLLRLQACLNDCEPGEKVHLVATDPGVLFDIPAWCKMHGHSLLSTEESDNLIEMVVVCGD